MEPVRAVRVHITTIRSDAPESQARSLITAWLYSAGRRSNHEHGLRQHRDILAQQAQKVVTHAATLNRLDALVQPVVQQVGLNTPPASPDDGQCWIVGSSPTSAWTGQAHRLAQRIGGVRVFYAHFVGLVVFDAATLSQWGWNGSAWTLVAPRLRQATVIYDPPSLGPTRDRRRSTPSSSRYLPTPQRPRASPGRR